MKIISELVKSQRRKLELTMEQLAQSAGVSQGFISRIEKGEYDSGNLSLDTIIRLAGALKLMVKDFISDSDPTEILQSPTLTVYLRHKYQIHKPEDIKMIEEIIQRLSKK